MQSAGERVSSMLPSPSMTSTTGWYMVSFRNVCHTSIVIVCDMLSQFPPNVVLSVQRRKQLKERWERRESLAIARHLQAF